MFCDKTKGRQQYASCERNSEEVENVRMSCGYMSTSTLIRGENWTTPFESVPPSICVLFWRFPRKSNIVFTYRQYPKLLAQRALDLGPRITTVFHPPNFLQESTTVNHKAVAEQYALWCCTIAFPVLFTVRPHKLQTLQASRATTDFCFLLAAFAVNWKPHWLSYPWCFIEYMCDVIAWCVAYFARSRLALTHVLLCLFDRYICFTINWKPARHWTRMGRNLDTKVVKIIAGFLRCTFRLSFNKFMCSKRAELFWHAYRYCCSMLSFSNGLFDDSFTESKVEPCIQFSRCS